MQTLTIPLVGSYFRPPAAQILKILPLGTPLILTPEPDNPYDPNAIQVLVSLSHTWPISEIGRLQSALEGTGYDACELIRQETEPEGGPLQLGYIAKSGSKTALGGPGNAELIAAIGTEHGDKPYTAVLSCHPNGSPTVTITISE